MRINRRVAVLPCRCGSAISNQFLRTTSTTVPASIEPFPPASPAKRNAHAPCVWHKGKGRSRPTTKSLAGLLVDREKQDLGDGVEARQVERAAFLSGELWPQHEGPI